eukprot:sb/3463717/
MRLTLFLTVVLVPCVVLCQSNSTSTPSEATSSATTSTAATSSPTPTEAPSAQPKPKPNAKYAQKKRVKTGKATYGSPKKGKKVNTGNAAYGRPAVQGQGYSPQYGRGNLQAQGWGQNAFGVQWTPSQQGGNQIPKYGGEGGIGAGGQVSGCYLQLSSGQWVWNSLTVVQQCGGFICLNTNPKQLHWTVRPDLIPHVAMQYCQAVNQQAPQQAAPQQVEESVANEESNAVEENNVPEAKESAREACECSAWDYPSDCSADGQQFRLTLFLTVVLVPCVVLCQSNSTSTPSEATSSATTSTTATSSPTPTEAPSAQPKPKPNAKYAQKKRVKTGKATYGSPKKGKKVNTGNAAYGRPAVQGQGYSPQGTVMPRGNLQAQGWGQNAFGVQWTPSQQGGNQIPKYGGEGGIGAGGQVSGCYLQLSSGQWVWNSLTVVQQCGGFICLNTNPKQLHWTVRPDLIPHVAMQYCQAVNQQAPQQAAPQQQEESVVANEESNAVEENNVPEVKESAPVSLPKPCSTLLPRGLNKTTVSGTIQQID